MTDQLAARWQRLLATMIDGVLVPSLTIFLVMVAGVVEDAEDFTDRWWILHVLGLAVFSYLLLNGYLLWRHGQTIGKKVLGIAIYAAGQTQSEDIKPASLWRLVCIRALFFPLLFIAIIPWFAPPALLDQIFIFGKRRRCLHDYVSGTVVLKKH